MHKNRNFMQSFKYAVSGFFFALMHERNLRFHIWAAVIVFIFAYNFGLTKIEWAALVMVITFVLVCELINTAVENAVDTATRKYSPTAKIAKDVAAGAVLISAVSAVVVGIILFSDAARITAALHTIFTDAFKTILFAVAAFVGGGFVLFGGKKRRKG